MQACYAGTQPLFNYVSNALQDIEHLHLVKALKNLEAFVYHFQMDVAPCTHMGDDVAAIEQWAAQFKNPTSLISSATKHYLFHKKQTTTSTTTTTPTTPTTPTPPPTPTPTTTTTTTTTIATLRLRLHNKYYYHYNYSYSYYCCYY